MGGMGFIRLNLKLALPVHSHLPTNNATPSSMLSSSASGRGREASFNSAQLSFLSNVTEEGEMLHKKPPRVCTSSLLTVANESFKIERIKLTTITKPYSSLNGNVFSGTDMPGSITDTSSLHFTLLMDNLNALEETMGDAGALNLEKDILLQLGRLGALKLFQTCLSSSFDASKDLELFYHPPEHNEEDHTKGEKDGDIKRLVRSGKRGVRGSKRERALEKSEGMSLQSLPSITCQKHSIQPVAASVRRASNSKKRRLMIAENEAEMSKGVKVIANLERIRKLLEEESEQVASLSCWAEAAGVDKNVLQRSLHFGWFCRDEILKSTRSLVLFLARNYRGLGIAVEDLIQAGNMGVILGAERFDHTRGYRFSTYVQYWIRKSMSNVVARHARGIRVPYTLGNVMNQIQKARKTLNYHHGRKYPDDEVIAKHTGLTVAKVKSASRCLRVVGSIDQKVGDGFSAKYMELMADQSMRSPEETVMRQHMKSDVWRLLETLEPREGQVLMLRYGLKDQRPNSLEEIGRVFGVSKEWIRKIEKKALKKLRDQESHPSLTHYLSLLS